MLMRKKFWIVFQILICLSFGFNGYAQLDPFAESVIVAYKNAVIGSKEVDLKRAWENLKNNARALLYIKENDDELFQHFTAQRFDTKSYLVSDSGSKTTSDILIDDLQPDAVLVSSKFEMKQDLKEGQSEVVEEMDIEQRLEENSKTIDVKPIKQADIAKEFPIQERRNNQQLLQDESLDDVWDNRDIVRRFPIQKNVDNRELIKQRLKQSQSSKRIRFDENETYGYEDEGFTLRSHRQSIVLSISGINASQRESMERLLKDYFGTIQNISDVGYARGIVEFLVTIDSNPEDFAERIQVTNFGSFKLELIEFLRGKLNFQLRPN